MGQFESSHPMSGPNMIAVMIATTHTHGAALCRDGFLFIDDDPHDIFYRL